MIFNFTVRGFSILGCRWHRDTGSIQLPVTFFYDPNKSAFAKKAVVCAYGAHINRLRMSLISKLQYDEYYEEVTEELACEGW